MSLIIDKPDDHVKGHTFFWDKLAGMSPLMQNDSISNQMAVECDEAPKRPRLARLPGALRHSAHDCVTKANESTVRKRESAEVNPNRLCEIWDAHHARLLLIARSIGGNVALPSLEDAVQEAFIELAKQSTEPHDVLGWLVRVTRNRIIDNIRGESRRQRREIAHGEQRWFTEPAFTQEVDAEQLSRVMETLEDLPRQIITMRVWGEMTFEAIAEVLEISSSSAHRHYHHALKVLGTQLQKDHHVTR